MTTDLVSMGADDARTLTDRIKVSVEVAWELIKQAYTSRAWSALGYLSWDDYCAREFGTSGLKLPKEDRPEVVGSMREAGMSIRAIASATGVSYGTVHHALNAGDQNRSPVEPTTTPGLAPDPDADTVDFGEGAPSDPDEDDSTDVALTQEECEALDESDMTDAEMARQAEAADVARITGTDGRSYPASKPTRTNRKPITDAFDTATFDLGKKVTSLTNLAADDRFNKNADQIAERNLSDLIRARDALQCVIDQLSN